jgi:ABC-type transporter lipoprotein component MlaA
MTVFARATARAVSARRSRAMQIHQFNSPIHQFNSPIHQFNSPIHQFTNSPILNQSVT